MQTAELLVELRHILSPTDAPAVLAALKEDELVWSALQAVDYLNSIRSEENCIPTAWSPAYIALRPLSGRVSFTDLTAEHIPGIEASLRKQALEFLEGVIRGNQSISHVSQAGLLALALRERRRKMQSWTGLNTELLNVPNMQIGEIVDLWKTPLACLYGIIPDKWDLLEHLMAAEPLFAAFEWITHILLSNPLALETQQHHFHDLMIQLPLEFQVEWLRTLKRKGRSTLVEQLANMLVLSNREILENMRDDFNPDTASWMGLSNKILFDQVAATLHQFSNHPAQALASLEKAKSLVHHWQVGISLQTASILGQIRGLTESEIHEFAEELGVFPVSEKLSSEALFVNQAQPVAGILNKVQAGKTPILYDVFRAEKLAESGSRAEAQEIALNAVNYWLKQTEEDPEILSGQFIFDYSPDGLVDALVNLGLSEEALRVGSKFLKLRPENLRFIKKMALLHHRFGEDQAASSLLFEVILMEPDNPETYRLLAGQLEDRHEWLKALDERKKVVDLVALPAIDDRLALARCALGGALFPLVLETCNRILAVDPENGMAYSLMGMTSVRQGLFGEGISLLSKATLLIPENPLPWIELADAYRKNGESQRAVETLRAAILTAPESAEIHFTLGKACLENGSITEALPYLRQSAKLAPESTDVALSLANVLFDLGHEPEALEVIAQARQTWPGHGGLAYLHARILLESQQKSEALEALEVTLSSENPQPEWLVLYARTLIGDSTNLLVCGWSDFELNLIAKAQKAIKRALMISPENFEARILLAETMFAMNEMAGAYSVYQQLVDNPLAQHYEFNWRIQAGLGRTALNLGQTETAIASLQNAVNLNSDLVELQRCLAEAYMKARLSDSAIRTAQNALALAPDNIENLCWYSGLMEDLGQDALAVDALRCATEISPDRSGLILRLAEVLLRKGDREESRAELLRVLESRTATWIELRSTAHAFIGLDDLDMALAGLEKSIQLCPQPECDLLFESAYLLMKKGMAEKSLELIQQAISLNGSRPEFYVLQSDLLGLLHRFQAALASLEHALRIVESGDDHPSEWILQKQALIQYDHEPVEIHTRFAKLLQKLDNLSSALFHAEKAVELCPSSFELRFIASKLALRLLQTDRAARLAIISQEQTESTSCFTAMENQDAISWQAELLSIQAEIALEKGDIASAGKMVNDGLAIAPSHPNLLALEVILLALHGDYPNGSELFEEIYQTKQGVEKAGIAPDQVLIGEAALALYRWDDGVRILEANYRNALKDPRAHFRYARGLIRAAECKILADQIQMNSHAPGSNAATEIAFGNIDQALVEAKKYSNSLEIDRWRARAEAVFHPSAVSVRQIASLAMGDEDSAMLVQAMSRIGNLDGARQVGQQFTHSVPVNLQLALMVSDNELGLASQAAERAKALDARNPIVHASHALVSEKCGDWDKALDSLESALHFWPNEPDWHEWAARLAQACDDRNSELAHLEAGYKFNSSSLTLIDRYSNALIRSQLFDKAAQVLQKGLQLDAGNADFWLLLAKAEYLRGNLPEALKNASRASSMRPESSSALVLCGEVSLAMGDYEKALEFVKIAQSLEPSDPKARLLACRILIKRGRSKEALVELSKAVDEMPHDLDLQLERATLIFKISGAREAVANLQKMSSEHPQDDRILALLAKAYSETNNLVEAEKAAAQSLRLNNHQQEMHHLLGQIYNEIGQLDKSIHHLSEAIRLQPNQVNMYFELGDVYTSRRDFSEALKTYAQAAKISPDDFRPYYYSALVLRDGKDYPGAESMMRKAAHLAPNDVNIRRQLGAIVALNLVHNCQEASSCQ